MSNFEQSKEDLNRELKKLVGTLNEMLPRYTLLLNKTVLSRDEIEELGEIEHFLIGLNAKISDIKERLQQDLFGHTLDRYYKLKPAAESGDQDARAKIDRLRKVFEEQLDKGQIINWN
jgi:DNA repair exonuclease SbcCD ATPase subunit